MKFSFRSCGPSQERLKVCRPVSIILLLGRIPSEHPTLLALGDGEQQGLRVWGGREEVEEKESERSFPCHKVILLLLLLFNKQSYPINEMNQL